VLSLIRLAVPTFRCFTSDRFGALMLGRTSLAGGEQVTGSGSGEKRSSPRTVCLRIAEHVLIEPGQLYDEVVGRTARRDRRFYRVSLDLTFCASESVTAHHGMRSYRTADVTDVHPLKIHSGQRRPDKINSAACRRCHQCRRQLPNVLRCRKRPCDMRFFADDHSGRQHHSDLYYAINHSEQIKSG
jgi:hypothetical protein